MWVVPYISGLAFTFLERQQHPNSLNSEYLWEPITSRSLFREQTEWMLGGRHKEKRFHSPISLLFFTELACFNEPLGADTVYQGGAKESSLSPQSPFLIEQPLLLLLRRAIEGKRSYQPRVRALILRSSGIDDDTDPLKSFQMWNLHHDDRIGTTQWSEGPMWLMGSLTR